MKKTLSAPPQTDARTAETLLQAYQCQKAQRTAADAEMKRLAEELELLAGRNPDWFASKRTCTFTHGKLAWTTRTEVCLPPDFDLGVLRAAFPACVRLSPSVSGVQQTLQEAEAASVLAQLGVGLKQQPLFTVKV